MLVVTGSNSHELRQGGERLPGRFGQGYEIEMLPMDFFEFQEVRKRAKWPKLSRIEELELYFKIGGFPAAVIESGPHGDEPNKSKEIYLKWLIGDITRSGRQEIYLKEILGQVALCTSSSLSLQKLAKKTQIGSHHTAQGYIEMLQDCFALSTLYCLDSNNGSYRFRKEKKFYFRDPLLYWLALEWSGVTSIGDHFPKVAELVANEFLFRRFDRIGYYSSKKGEIDFYQHHNWAIEIKWRESASNLSSAYLDLRIPEKIVWTKENFLDETPSNLKVK